METSLQETKKIGFWGGNKEGYRTAFHMAWPAVMESFFISFAIAITSFFFNFMDLFYHIPKLKSISFF